MDSEALTLYKLIILYMLAKVDFPLTNAQISNFILEKEYTNYFTIQQAISDLLDSDLIRCETIRNSSFYHMRPAGQETIEFFKSKISPAIQEDIMEHLKQNEYSLRDEVSNLADYYLSKKDEYVVRCQVKEGGTPIIDLSMTVTSEEEAATICNNWKSKSQEVYAYVLQTLMKHN